MTASLNASSDLEWRKNVKKRKKKTSKSTSRVVRGKRTLSLFTAQFECGRDRKDGRADESVNDRAKKRWRFTVNASKSFKWAKRYGVRRII